MAKSAQNGKNAVGKVSTHKTVKGPHGGGHTYHQVTLGKGFLRHAPITGHSQQGNLPGGNAKK